MKKLTVVLLGMAIMFIGCNTDYKKAVKYRKQGDWTNAQEYMLKAVKANPKNAHLHNEMGYIYQKRRYYELAEKEYKRATGLDPYYVEAHLNRGSVLFQMRRFTQAQQEFETVLELDPNNTKALNGMGLTVHIFERNHQKALEYYQQTIKLEPDNPVFHENLSRLYNDMGEAEKAQESMRRAMALKARRTQ